MALTPKEYNEALQELTELKQLTIDDPRSTKEEVEDIKLSIANLMEHWEDEDYGEVQEGDVIQVEDVRDDVNFVDGEYDPKSSKEDALEDDDEDK